MSEGIKETKEALVAVNELSLLLVKHLKDGLQASDVASIWTELSSSPEVLAKVTAAWDKISDVPAEVKDLDLSESVELGMIQASYVSAYIDQFKGS